MPTRTGEARWEGTLKEGRGTVRFSTFEGPYTFASRFEEGDGTNPEELIGAAHAGCFSMKLSGELTSAGYEPTRIETTAHVTIEAGTITTVRLVTRAEVPGVDDDEFQSLAQSAKENCPVSKALAGPEIELEATLA